ISKNKQSRYARLRVLLAIPAAFALMVLFSFTSLENTPSLLRNNIIQPAFNNIHKSFDKQQSPQQKPISKQPIKVTPKDTATNKTHYEGGYPGGYLAWLDFMKSNYRFPSGIIKRGHSQYIEVSFIASEQGEIKNLKVTKGINKECDKEALRVLNIMPKWSPILKDGKLCSPLFHLTISLKPNPAKRNGPPITTCDIAMGDGAPVTPSNENKPLLLVEKNPEFKGGLDAMLDFLKKNTHYPEEAKKQGIQGTVFIYFTISKTGTISDVKVLKGISKECDEEAIRVVKAMPNWIPGQTDGKDVPVVFQIPIKFQNKIG
ncbi:MAG: TonB family protein, partial [Bacteroidetes bacterium]|nr:TonB family protein [Bacteroidota bacterium]